MSVSINRQTIWRVPLIALIAGFAYAPCYVRIVCRFGIVEPGVLDDTVCLLTSGFLMAAALVLGGLLLLRNQTRMDIFVSSSVVAAYGLILFAAQFLSGSTSGPAAVVFLHLNTPLEWTIFPSSLSLFLQEHHGITVPGMGYLRFFVPWLFILFGKRAQKTEPPSLAQEAVL